MRRVKGLFTAMFSQADIEVTDDNVGALMVATTEAAMKDSELSPIGTQVVCEIFDEKSSPRDGSESKMYSSERWSPPPKA